MDRVSCVQSGAALLLDADSFHFTGRVSRSAVKLPELATEKVHWIQIWRICPQSAFLTCSSYMEEGGLLTSKGQVVVV